jgi:hypothetical protein
VAAARAVKERRVDIGVLLALAGRCVVPIRMIILVILERLSLEGG